MTRRKIQQFAASCMFALSGAMTTQACVIKIETGTDSGEDSANTAPPDLTGGSGTGTGSEMPVLHQNLSAWSLLGANTLRSASLTV